EGHGMSAVVKRVVCDSVPDSPQATWSNALVIGQEVILSGQTAHPASQQAAQAGEPLGAYAQTMEVLRKIDALLTAAGGNRHNITKLVVYVTNIEDKGEVGRARRDFFGQAPWPASTLVGVQALVFPELCVEIDAFARLDVDLRQAQ